jgi:hypothetical protein
LSFTGLTSVGLSFPWEVVYCSEAVIYLKGE